MASEISDSVDESWICLDEFPERNWYSRHCFFMFLQQFNRTYPNSPGLEAFFISFISASGVLLNIVAVIQYHRNRFIRSEFCMLLTVLSACNIVFCLFGFFVAIARVYDDWQLFGNFGCQTFFTCSLLSFYLAVWSMTLISIERRSSVRKCCSGSQVGLTINPTSASSRVSQRKTTIRIGLFLLILLLFDLTVWIFYIVFQQRAIVKSVFVNDTTGSGSYNREVLVCTIFTTNYTSLSPGSDPRTGSLIVSALLLLGAIIIPLPIIIANYCSIYFFIKKSLARNDNHGNGCGTENYRIQRDGSKKRKKIRKDLYFAKLMVTILVLFIVCNVPILVYIVLILTDDVTDHPTTDSYIFVICLGCAYANAAFSPLLQSISKGKKRQVRATISPAIVDRPYNRKSVNVPNHISNSGEATVRNSESSDSDAIDESIDETPTTRKRTKTTTTITTTAGETESSLSYAF